MLRGLGDVLQLLTTMRSSRMITDAPTWLSGWELDRPAERLNRLAPRFGERGARRSGHPRSRRAGRGERIVEQQRQWLGVDDLVLAHGGGVSDALRSELIVITSENSVRWRIEGQMLFAPSHRKRLHRSGQPAPAAAAHPGLPQQCRVQAT